VYLPLACSFLLCALLATRARDLTNHRRAGFDAEFRSDANIEDRTGIYSVQLLVDGESIYIATPDELDAVLNRVAEKPTVLYGFNMLCDLGAVQTWCWSRGRCKCKSPDKCKRLRLKRLGNQDRAIWSTQEHSGRRRRIVFLDVRPIAKAIGLSSLEKVGAYVGVPKLPDAKMCHGCPHFPCPEDETRWRCRKYAENDPRITLAFAEKVKRDFNLDLACIGTTGQLARHYFPLPKRFDFDKKGNIHIPLIEIEIKKNCFAGRADMMQSGYFERAFINDFKSLYPVTILVSRCLFITGVEPCRFEDLDLSENHNHARYGWIEGKFRTSCDLWGLPIKGADDRNRYVTGVVSGMLHTFNIVAARAEILEVGKCFKPIFSFDSSTLQQLDESYRSVAMRRLRGELRGGESDFLKSALNSLGGCLGQCKPFIARHTNFPAYDSMVACSHLIMRKMFDAYKGKIYGMDTDSIIGSDPFDYQHDLDGIPHQMRVQAEGELYYFRPKRYLMRTVDGYFKTALMGWRYGTDAYESLWDVPEELDVVREVKRTMKVRENAALLLRLGGWREKKVTLGKDELQELLRADDKRVRSEYDSLKLCEEQRSCPSTALVQTDPWESEDSIMKPVAISRLEWRRLIAG